MNDSESIALPFWLSPSHQRLNASLATAMMSSLASRGLLQDLPLSWQAAMIGASWPGRFEVLRPKLLRVSKGSTSCSEYPILLIDVAHNEPAVAALLRSIDAAWPQAPLAIIFGANRDKDVTSIVKRFTVEGFRHNGRESDRHRN